MSNITTIVYDTDRSAVGVEALRSLTTSLVFDSVSTQVQSLDVHSGVTTCDFVDSRCSSLDGSNAGRPNQTAVNSQESCLVAKLLAVLRNPPQSGQPLWWQMWNTLAEDPWLRSQQVAIARRLVWQQELIDEMCQFSSIHFGSVLERWPSLGLSLDEFPAQIAWRMRRIIRRDFSTWLRVRSREHRRMPTWSAEDFVDVRHVELIDELEIAAAMADLPVLHRDVVEMRSVRYRRIQIARALNLSIYQVDRIFHSCRQHLRHRLRLLRPD